MTCNKVIWKYAMKKLNFFFLKMYLASLKTIFDKVLCCITDN